MAQRTKIKVGQIGICHEHAAAKMTSLRRLTDVYEIIGVVDDRKTSAARFAGNDLKPYEGLTWMTEETLRSHPELEALIIETPNGDLVPTAIRCLKRNLPMHMDKPGGKDLELFRQLLDGCRQRNLPFQMGYMFRNNRAMQFCKRAMDANWLGGIFEMQASMSHNYGGEAYQKYIGNFAGGVMFNLGCHLIDTIICMLGRPYDVTPFLKSCPDLIPPSRTTASPFLNIRMRTQRSAYAAWRWMGSTGAI
ncbi:MAG: Gfo/Idh/MocA family oxidoreductase [Nibricoccus sp.]